MTLIEEENSAKLTRAVTCLTKDRRTLIKFSTTSHRRR